VGDDRVTATLPPVPGVAETALGEALRARLPADSPPAPWAAAVRAVVWWHRAAPGAATHVHPALRRRPTLPLTVGAFVTYDRSPVGPYREVLASPVLVADALPAPVHIPFIAVDSVDSLHGGRANWALPKTLAAFGPGFTARSDGDGPPWSVEARVRARPRAVTVSVTTRALQVGAADEPLRIPVRLHGRVRPARVEVAATGPTLAAWLRPGTHAGVVVEGHARFEAAAVSPG
jgi:hypothetical protein